MLTASMLLEDDAVCVSSVGEVESHGNSHKYFFAAEDTEFSAEPEDLDDPCSSVTCVTPNICVIDSSDCRKASMEMRKVLPTTPIWELLKPPQVGEC